MAATSSNMAGSLMAKQDNSYENRLRFLRGKIARIQYQPSPPQALVTPGVQNYESAYMTVRDGKILATYKAISSGGIYITAPGCCKTIPIPDPICICGVPNTTILAEGNLNFTLLGDGRKFFKVATTTCSYTNLPNCDQSSRISIDESSTLPVGFEYERIGSSCANELGVVAPASHTTPNIIVDVVIGVSSSVETGPCSGGAGGIYGPFRYTLIFSG